MQLGISPRFARINGFKHIHILRVDCVNDNKVLIMQQTIKLFQIHKTLNKILLKQIRYFLKQIRYPMVCQFEPKYQTNSHIFNDPL